MNFLILSLPRSGSSNLARLLNTHPRIRCLTEPFAAQNYDGVYHRLAATPAGLDATLELIWDRWNGIKHVWDSGGYPFPERPELNRRLVCSPGVRILLLKRRNLLRRWVSNYISYQTSLWFGPRADFEAALSRLRLRRMDPAAVRHQIAADRKTVAQCERALSRSGASVLPIYYEDIYRDDATPEYRFQLVNRILAFLEFSAVSREVFVKEWHRLLDPGNRWATPEVYRRIPGIDRIEAECGSDATGWLFR